MSEPKQILIVEDNPQLAEMLGGYFGAQAYDVATVHRGEDALALLDQQSPDLVLLDVNLPGIDGFDTCRRLRQMPAARHTPVLFLTERRDREDILEGLELGAVDYVTKPFDIHELSLRVANVLHRVATPSPMSALTGLPQGAAVLERLRQMVTEGDWALVIVQLVGLGRFRDRHGFVAAEDVIRATALIIANAKQAAQADNDFVGHLGPVSFAIVTAPGREESLAHHCLSRLQAAIPYFYPTEEKGPNSGGPVSADLQMGSLIAQVRTLAASDSAVADLVDLQAALLAPA